MGYDASETKRKREEIKKRYTLAKQHKLLNLMTPKQIADLYDKLKAENKL